MLTRSVAWELVTQSSSGGSPRSSLETSSSGGGADWRLASRIRPRQDAGRDASNKSACVHRASPEGAGAFDQGAEERSVNRSSPDKHPRGREAFSGLGGMRRPSISLVRRQGWAVLPRSVCGPRSPARQRDRLFRHALLQGKGLDAAPLAALKRAGGDHFVDGRQGGASAARNGTPCRGCRCRRRLSPDRSCSELGAAAARVRQLLDNGQTVILASKGALLGDTEGLLEWPRRRSRLGICALLGGTGLALINELEELRAKHEEDPLRAECDD